GRAPPLLYGRRELLGPVLRGGPPDRPVGGRRDDRGRGVAAGDRDRRGRVALPGAAAADPRLAADPAGAPGEDRVGEVAGRGAPRVGAGGGRGAARTARVRPGVRRGGRAGRGPRAPGGGGVPAGRVRVRAQLRDVAVRPVR